MGYQNDKEVFKAVCADCGNNCDLPFKPTGTKPVKCRDCFKKSDQGGRNDRGGRGGFGDRPKPKPTIDYTKQLESISAKMDKIIRLLETGTLERPEGTSASQEREERKEEKQTVNFDELKDVIENGS